LLALMIEEVAPIVWKHGVFYGLCNYGAWTRVRSFLFTTTASEVVFQPLEFYYMINYYIKYLELIDTVFLALKKKPLGDAFFTIQLPRFYSSRSPVAFLHVFHHSATALLCYSQLNGKTSIVCSDHHLSNIISLFLITHLPFSHGFLLRSTSPFTSSCVCASSSYCSVPDPEFAMPFRLLLLCNCGWRENLGTQNLCGAICADAEFVTCVQWKKYLTTMQIVQFIIDLCAVYFGSKPPSCMFFYCVFTLSSCH
jgi:hypothetical protein